MPLRTGRRYLSYSLRTLFVLMTAFAVWFGVIVNRAREQREAVKAIEERGGAIIYDWQESIPISVPFDPRGLVLDDKPPGPPWLRRLIGDDYFQKVEYVRFDLAPLTPDVEIRETIPALKRLPGHVVVLLPDSASGETRDKLVNALPNCRVGVLAE